MSEQMTDSETVETTVDETEEPEATSSDDAGKAGRPSKVQRLEQEGDIAADYLEELLDIADLDGDLDMDVEGDRASVQIDGSDLQQLVGRNGEVLEALQELTRLAVYRETGERSRLMLDVGGHRAEQRTRLVALAEKSIAEVKERGESLSLEPMSAFERKVVHDAVAAAGLSVRVRRRGAEAARGDPSRVSEDVSRETAPSVPEVARRAFASDRVDLAVRYTELLATEGVTRGLIGPREADRLWERHVLNSAVLAEAIPQGSTVCDIGTGAGLPGLVVAIARPDITMTLVEPLLRRTTFLDEVVSELGLDHVRVVRGRADELHGRSYVRRGDLARGGSAGATCSAGPCRWWPPRVPSLR